MPCLVLLLLAAQHVRQVVAFTHKLGQRQASVLAARVVEVRLVKNSSYIVSVCPCICLSVCLSVRLVSFFLFSRLVLTHALIKKKKATRRVPGCHGRAAVS
jgi:hypothetical protein